MFRDIIVFLAGFEAFHTISHVGMPYFVKLPLQTNYVVLTPELNYWAIFINGVITIGLILLAARLKRA